VKRRAGEKNSVALGYGDIESGRRDDRRVTVSVTRYGPSCGVQKHINNIVNTKSRVTFIKLNVGV